MMDDAHMEMEEEVQPQHQMMAPAVADPATAALTAAPQPESEDAAESAQAEQEDPAAGRNLPEESPPLAELPEELPPDAGEEAEEEPLTAPPAEEEPPPPAAEPPEPAPAEPPLMQQAAATPAAQPAPNAAQQQYWREVLTGSVDTVPDSVRARAGLDSTGLTEEQREYRLLSTINRSWAADHLGVSREQVRSGWGRLRGLLARRFHVADDEQELFTALSFEAQDAPRRKQVEELYAAHYSAALLGREAPPAKLAEDEENAPWAAGLASEARSRGEALRRQYLPLARELAEGLTVFAALEDDAVAAPRVLASVPAFARAVNALADMDEGSRQLVYAIAQAEFRSRQPQKEESLYRTMLRSSRRGSTALGMGAGMAVVHTAVSALNSMSSSLSSSLGEKFGRPLREGSVALDLRARIAEETRRLLYEEVKPLKVSEEAGLAGKLMVDAAGAVPAAVAACSGGVGFAALSISGAGEAVTAARLRAPEGRQSLQYFAGVLGATIQASIYAGMSRVGGQLLSNAIARFARSVGKGGGSYTLSSLGVLGAMGAEDAKLLVAGKAAELVGLGTQELASRVDRTASNIDWSEYGDNAQDIELNLREAAMNLPFILIASGRVALRHFRSRAAVLGEGRALEDWGIDENTRKAVMNERDIDRQGELLREALGGSRRWSAPGFIFEAIRALRLLNTDYYQGFKDKQTVVDFLNLPSQGSQVPRPPLVPYSAENPEHVRLLEERHGSGEKVNRRRLPQALQLFDEWWQKAHLVPGPSEATPRQSTPPDYGEMLPTTSRRLLYGRENMLWGPWLPARVRPGGFYSPHAEAERMAMLRDRVAELHDLSYQTLLISFPLDSLTHSSRSVEHMRRDGESARASLLQAVGRFVIRRATGVPEHEAMQELGQTVTNYFWRRRYSSFPPGWMNQVKSAYTQKLDEYARATFSQEMEGAPPELVAACRVALGFRACATALCELLPTTPDFRTALSRGLSPAEAYEHLLSRELGVDVSQARGVQEMLAPLKERKTDMQAYLRRNEAAFEAYSALTGCELEEGSGAEDGASHWRVRRPDGHHTYWHRSKGDAINDLVGNTASIFMPFSYDRLAPLRTLEPGRGYDLNTEGKAGAREFTGYDNLCRVALRDAARTWMESAPYALPGFELGTLRRYVYLGGQRPASLGLMRESQNPDMMQVDRYTLSSPLRLAQARFHTYWWRQLNSGLLPAETAAQELVKLRVMSPEEWEKMKDIAKPLLMPRGKDVPLKLTPPPDIPGMNRALAGRLTDFSLRYFLGHLDDMPLPASTREWFRLAPLCPLEPSRLWKQARRISVERDAELYTCFHNRMAAHELREAAPAVAGLRQAESEGLLEGSPLLTGLRDAVGLNRVQNLEQAWCMNQVGGEAMQSAAPPFWPFMERPYDGWQAFDAGTQQSLRRHVEGICRTSPAPESTEAEARGETPDFVLDGLRNLQEVLQEYPSLHQYGLALEHGQPLVRRLVLEEAVSEPAPFAEPEYEPAAIYTGGTMQRGFNLGKLTPLPDFLQDDSRVLPALHLLGGLRAYPGSRPFARHEGIEWRGKLYGGPWGHRPRGLEDIWMSYTPLKNLLEMFSQIDELNRMQPGGTPYRHLGMELRGLEGEELDMTPLINVSLYRHLRNPSRLCRLMPGEPEAGTLAARSPYVVSSVSGICLEHNTSLREPEEMYRSYTPLENFRPGAAYLGSEVVRRELSRKSLDYTLSGVLSDSVRMASQDNPHGGLASMRELLLRFTEDSGFSMSLYKVAPHELTDGQVRVLSLARELLLCVCGAEPEAAYQRLLKLEQSVSANPSAREAMLRALYGAADSLYDKGKHLFKEGEEKKTEEKKTGKKRSRRSTRRSSVRKDNNALDVWYGKQERVKPGDRRRWFESDREEPSDGRYTW